MKGVILAGGKGTRLFPLTAVTNKHLVPVGRLPMIEYPLFTLQSLKVQSVSIVTGGEHFDNVSKYLESLHGETRFSYHNQAEAGGIAQALGLTCPFVRDSRIAVILGDNIFEDDFSQSAREFESSDLSVMLFLKRVPDPERFGVAEVKDGKIVSIEEKPKSPKSDLAVTGIYFYGSDVFDKIKSLKPSARGEYEITDVNNEYLRQGKLGYRVVNGFWSDAGIPESLLECANWVKENKVS